MPSVVVQNGFRQPPKIASGGFSSFLVFLAAINVLYVECLKRCSFPVVVLSTHEIANGERLSFAVLNPAVNSALHERLDEPVLFFRDPMNFSKLRGVRKHFLRALHLL